MGIPKNEQVTTVSFGRNDERAIIYTSDRTIISKLQKHCRKNGTEWRIEREVKAKNDDSVAGVYFSCPKHLVFFRSRKTQRKITDEQKLDMANRLQQARKGG